MGEHLVLLQHEVISLGTILWGETLAIKNWEFVTDNSNNYNTRVTELVAVHYLFINHDGVQAAHPSWINH